MPNCLLADIASWNGWIHLIQDGHDLPRGPLGVLLYLPFCFLFRLVSPPHRSAYLVLTSVFLALVTLGPGYSLTLIALVLISLSLLRHFATRTRLAGGLFIWAALYLWMLFFPRPSWLPPTSTPSLHEPILFYLHWAGLAYLFLRTTHVLVDVALQRCIAPSPLVFCAYLLFAPTLRMGPLYRLPEFQAELAADLAARRSVSIGAGRIAIGLLRLGIMAAIAKNIHLAQLLGEPEELARLRPGHLIAGLYLAPMTIYLWISGYTDLAIGLGRLMGFIVPENFNYPWVATNLADFWRRWHLTLSFWLRDYIYIPLGGNRRHVYCNYVLTFLFCGFWHGPRPAMLLWGLSQGVGLSVWKAWNRRKSRQAEAATPFCHRLRRLHLVKTRLSAILAWLLTFHYQILTIVIIMDEQHAGYHIARRLLVIFGLSS